MTNVTPITEADFDPHVDIDIIRNDTIEMEKMVEARGYLEADVHFKIRWINNEDFILYVSFAIPNTQNSYGGLERVHESFSFNDPSEYPAARKKAKRYIADLKDVDVLRMDAFRRQLGRLLDRGRELGVSDELFINPLTEMMLKLSENVIEDQSD